MKKKIDDLIVKLHFFAYLIWGWKLIEAKLSFQIKKKKKWEVELKKNQPEGSVMAYFL